MEETLKTASADHHKIESSISPEDSSNLVLKLEDVNVVNTGKTSRTYIFMAILVVLLPVLAAYFLNREQAIFNLIEV